MALTGTDNEEKGDEQRDEDREGGRLCELIWLTFKLICNPLIYFLMLCVLNVGIDSLW